MFTGLVEDLGRVRDIRLDGDSARLSIDTSLDGIATGDSVAVNGVCLTAADAGGGGFAADAMGETLRRTARARLEPGAAVNLERALAAGGRFGGHIVQGHVDGVGTVVGRRDEDAAVVFAVAAPPDVHAYLVEKGSVCLDGISLTVSALTDEGFEVWCIPHTLTHTTLGEARVGAPVNLEVDVLAKYVERLLSQRKVSQ